MISMSNTESLWQGFLNSTDLPLQTIYIYNTIWLLFGYILTFHFLYMAIVLLSPGETLIFSYISRSVLSWRTDGRCLSPTTLRITTALCACTQNTYGKSPGRGRDSPRITATHTKSEATSPHRPSWLRWPSNLGQSCHVYSVQVWSSTQERVCPAVMVTWRWVRPWRRFWRRVSFNWFWLFYRPEGLVNFCINSYSPVFFFFTEYSHRLHIITLEF